MKKSFLSFLLFCCILNFASKDLFAQSYTGAGGVIPDTGVQTCFSHAVTGVPSTSGLVSVEINITHPNDADLDITLVPPVGAPLELSTDNGGAGDNYTSTVFVMNASDFIYDGAAPFTGSYKPEGCGGFFRINAENSNPNGLWQVCVTDDTGGNSGTLVSWKLIFAPTNKNPMPSDDCGVAPIVCSFDSYMGITYPAAIGCYTPSTVTSFCGSIENNSWLQFQASGTSVVLEVNVQNCTSGIQFALYSGTCAAPAYATTNTTGSTPSTADAGTACFWEMTPGVNTLYFNSLTIGATYYLMVDGFGGDVCDYLINPVSGVAGTQVTASIPSGATACPGDAVTLTAFSTGGDTYTWSSDPPGFTATGATVTANPTTTTTYFVTATVSSGICAGTQTASTTIVVFEPQVDASTVLLPCGGGTSDLTITNLPASNTYIVSTPAYAAETHAGTSVSLGDDAVSAALNIGFTFNFFGTDYTQFRIGSNGYISLGSTAGPTSTYGDLIPEAATPNDYIGLAFGDLDPSSGGTIRYQTLGVAPNRRCVISFQNVPHYDLFGSSLVVTGQVVLYETSNIVDIICINIDDDGNDKTMGIENSDGTLGYAVPGRNYTAWGCSSNTTRFTPQTNTITWSTGATNVPSITVNAPGSYSATVNGCLSNVVTINVNAPFDLDLDNDGTLDASDLDISASSCSFLIDANPSDGNTTGATITWSSTDPNFVAPAAGVYTYTAVPTQCSAYTYTASVSRSGCTVTKTITVTCSGATFTTDLDGNGSSDAADQTLMTCSTLNFDATLSPAAPNANTTTSYVWTSNDPAFVDPGNTPLYNGADSPYYYQVVITRGNCAPITRRITIFCSSCPAPGILMANLPSFNALTNTTTITTCSSTDPALTWDASITNCGTGLAGSGTVDCTSGITYTWTLGGVDVTPAVDPHLFTATQPGTYQLSVVTGTCIKTRTFVVNGIQPIVSLPDVVSCNAETLDATPTNYVSSSTYTYTWYYSPTYTGTYTMIGAPGTTATLTIGSGVGYQGTGFYAVKVQRDDFTPTCTEYDTMQYSFDDAPVISSSLIGANFISCSQMTINLQDYITNYVPTATYSYILVGSVSGTITASFSDPAVFTLPTATGVVSETYTVTFKRGAYCPTVINFTFTTNPPVLPSLANITSCTPTTVNATATNPQSGDVYSWTGPGGFSSSSPIITVSVAGTYTVLVSRGTLGNCNKSKSFTFTVPAPPVVNTQLEYIACDAANINADPSGANSAATVYTWTNLVSGEINASVTNTANLLPGHYSVKASNGALCNTTKSFYITCPALTLSAIYNDEADLVNVTWTDTSNIEIGFELQRTDNVGSGVWTTVAFITGGLVFPANWLSYADANLEKNTEYCYRVRYILPAFTGSPNPNYSGFSNLSCITVPKGDSPGEGTGPYEYKLHGIAGNQSATLYWQVADEAYGFQFYDVYFGIAPNEPTVRIGTTDKHSFVIPGLLNGKEYLFKVRARYRASNDPYYFSETISLRPSIILGEEENNKTFSFELYPNPNNGEFEVSLSGKPSEKLTISLITVSGQVLMSKTVADFNGSYRESMQFTELPSGLYFLQIHSGDEILQKKVSIVR